METRNIIKRIQQTTARFPKPQKTKWLSCGYELRLRYEPRRSAGITPPVGREVLGAQSTEKFNIKLARKRKRERARRRHNAMKRNRRSETNE